MDLLNICLTSTYFQYNGKHYKQLHGTAMGSPVSVVVAEIVMQHVEERALATCRQTIPLWLRYVDDTFTAIHKDEIDAFHDHLNALISGHPGGVTPGNPRAFAPRHLQIPLTQGQYSSTKSYHCPPPPPGSII